MQYVWGRTYDIETIPELWTTKCDKTVEFFAKNGNFHGRLYKKYLHH